MSGFLEKDSEALEGEFWTSCIWKMFKLHEFDFKNFLFLVLSIKVIFSALWIFQKKFLHFLEEPFEEKLLKR